MLLRNKMAIVTGASTGIGRAISLEFARNGAFCFLVARTKERLEETQELIEQDGGGKTEICLADLASTNSINKLIFHIKSKTKRIDILANVAGIWHGENEVYADRDFSTFSQQVILDTYLVGLTAPTLLAHAFIPLMGKNGKILNISGTFASGAKGWLSYYVSKRAIEDLTIGLSQELKDKNICVNCISPSDVATEAYKKYYPQYIKEALSPEEIAKYAVYLCSSQNQETGQVVVLKKCKKPFIKFHA